MNKSKGLLVDSIRVSLAIIAMSGASAAAPVLTPQDIKAASVISSNRSVVAESIQPKTSDYIGEDELPIPEGVKPINGMNIPLQMKEIKIYGIAHKPYGQAFLQKAIANAVQYHNTLKEAPALKGHYKIRRKGNSYSILVNAETYLAFAYAVAHEITKKYQSDQFLLARAIVPEQKINQKSGSVEICVAESYLSADPIIVISQDTKKAEKIKRLLAPHLSKLKNLKPLDFNKLERTLLLIRDMPGVEIKTTFKQAENTLKTDKQNKQIETNSICEKALNNGAGSTLLEVRVTADQLDGEVSIDNFGTDALGPEIMHFKVGVNSQIKAGDRYDLSISRSTDKDETLNYLLNAQIPIGLKGLKAKFFHSNGDARPGGFIDGLQVSNKTIVTGISLEYPYIRSRKKNLTFEVGLRHHNVVTDSAAGELENSDLNTLRLRAIYDFSDKGNGINLISGELVTGLSGKYSNGAVSSPDTKLDPHFFMLRGELARYQAINLKDKATGSMTWVNSLTWQYTNDPLFSSEEFALGGRDYGRGFDLSILTGDQAIALKTELQYKNKMKYGDYKAYGFADYGRVKSLDKTTAPEDVIQSLASVGVGIELTTKNNWFMKIELTNPVNISLDDVTIDPHAYLQIGYRW